MPMTGMYVSIVFKNLAKKRWDYKAQVPRHSKCRFLSTIKIYLLTIQSFKLMINVLVVMDLAISIRRSQTTGEYVNFVPRNTTTT